MADSETPKGQDTPTDDELGAMAIKLEAKCACYPDHPCERWEQCVDLFEVAAMLRTCKARISSLETGLIACLVREQDANAKAFQHLRRAEQAEAEAARLRDSWQPVTTYDLSMELVQVLCEVTEPETDDFPRECDMPISSGDHAVGDLFVSIGWQDDDGVWYVAGWDMNQDCWTEARCFVVKGWQPLPHAALREGGEANG